MECLEAQFAVPPAIPFESGPGEVFLGNGGGASQVDRRGDAWESDGLQTCGGKELAGCGSELARAGLHELYGMRLCIAWLETRVKNDPDARTAVELLRRCEERIRGLLLGEAWSQNLPRPSSPPLGDRQ